MQDVGVAVEECGVVFVDTPTVEKSVGVGAEVCWFLLWSGVNGERVDPTAMRQVDRLREEILSGK